MALYLTKLPEEPSILYNNVGGLSGFVKGKKSDIRAYTDPVPRLRAVGMQLVGSLILVPFVLSHWCLTHFLIMDISSFPCSIKLQ